MTEPVRYEQTGRIVTLTMNEPDTLNAISPAIIEGLVAACERINRDMEVSCVIVTGAGKSFSSGGNIKEMRQKTGMFGGSAAEIRRAYQHGIQRIPQALFTLEVPTIAAVNGHAIGAGCDVSLCCDIRLAADNAVFAESFLRVGLVSGDGGAWLLPKAVGLSRAYELTFTGDMIDAQQAAACNLVSRVVPAASLMSEARALATRIAAHPPHSIRLTKKLIRESLDMSLDASLEMAAGMQAIVQNTQDQHEAVSALLDKRTPRFEGR